MVYEPNESKVANLLATINELADHDKIMVLVDCIVELEKAITALQKRLEDHEVLTPEFCRKEAEFQKMREQFEKHDHSKPIGYGEY